MDVLLDVSVQHAGYTDHPQAVRDIHFSVRQGELVGLIGANGAGKSTTIKAILNLLPHVNGEISFKEEQNRYAYIPEQPILYEDLTLWEHLELAAAAFAIDAFRFETRANDLLDRFRMREAKHHLPDSFSKGMQQKLMMMIAFLIDPSVYIVDEPFVGLDPKATVDFLDLLDRKKKEGAGILMSTHILDTAERICDRFVLIHQGRCLAAGTLAELRQHFDRPSASLYDCFQAVVEDTDERS